MLHSSFRSKNCNGKQCSRPNFDVGNTACPLMHIKIERYLFITGHIRIQQIFGYCCFWNLQFILYLLSYDLILGEKNYVSFLHIANIIKILWNVFAWVKFLISLLSIISCFSVVYRRITVDYHSIISLFQAVKLPFIVRIGYFRIFPETQSFAIHRSDWLFYGKCRVMGSEAMTLNLWRQNMTNCLIDVNLRLSTGK